MKKKAIAVLSALAVVAGAGFASFAVSGYSAVPDKIATESSVEFDVKKTEKYLFYDNKACTDTAIVFYGGAKVDELSYTALLSQLAEYTDVFLIDYKMNLPILNTGKCQEVLSEYAEQYQTICLCGHSMGGASMDLFASSHPDEKIRGIVFLGSYGTTNLPENISELVYIYGENDGVINQEKLHEDIDRNKGNSRKVYTYEIQGGNHAGFGYYGAQKGDKEATISSEEQIQQTVSIILEILEELKQKKSYESEDQKPSIITREREFGAIKREY